MLVWQELVTFEDIAIYLSRTEYDAIEEEQRELYRSVMLDNYKLLMSLGKPAVLMPGGAQEGLPSYLAPSEPCDFQHF